MTPQQIDQAAQALAGARKGQALPGLPQAVRPQSREDAFAIQDAVMAKLGEKPGGWKVGALPDGGSFVAPIYASAVPDTLMRTVLAVHSRDHWFAR